MGNAPEVSIYDHEEIVIPDHTLKIVDLHK